MSSILPWVLVAISLGALCMVLLIWAILARKFSILYVALGILALAGLAAAMAMYRLAERSVDELRNLATPRTGEQIYDALFGPATDACVRIIAFDDAVIPKLDNVIHLHAHTCPAEVRRILASTPYTRDSTELSSADNVPARFATALLGSDAITLQATLEEGKHWRTLHLRADSSALIVHDIAD
jgi:hypothetical protein